MKHKLWHRAAFVLLGSVAIAACNDSTDPTPTASAIEAVTATSISGAAGTAASISPTVRVLGPGGAPVAGAIVQFRVTSGLGSVEFADVVTDANGVASAGVWTLGPHPGVQTVTATVEGAAPVVFSSNTGVGPANKITQLLGWTTQVLEPLDVVPTNLSIRVTDFFNQIHVNSPVTFAVISGGGNIGGQTSVTVNTNAQGIATVGPWNLGPLSGIQQVRATSGPVNVLFTVIACPTLDFSNPAAGTITNSGCVIDGFFRNNYGYTTTAGQAILVTLTSTQFNARVDVTTPALVPLASNDNEIGGPAGSTNSALRFIPATSGEVTVGAIATPAGATGSYTLSITNTDSEVDACGPQTFVQIGVANLAQELTEDDCLTPGTTPFYAAPYDGSGAYPADQFNIYLTAGQQVRIRMAPTGAAIDAMIVVFSPTNVRTFRDGNFVSNNGTEEFTYTAATTGFHRVYFTAFGLTTGVEDDLMFGPYTASFTTP